MAAQGDSISLWTNLHGDCTWQPHCQRCIKNTRESVGRARFICVKNP